MPLAAARLRERITVRRLVDVPDGKGGYDRDWQTVVADLPAEVVSQGGREAFLGMTLEGVSAFRITIRKRDDVHVKDQIVWQGRELNILNVEADFREQQAAMVIFADSAAPLGAT